MNIESSEKYIAVCKSSELYEGKGKKIQFPEDDDFQVAIFRIDGQLYCLDNICPHRHADRIYEGFVKNGTVTCPLHGWSYSLDSGQNINQLQGIKSLSKYEIFEKNGTIYIEKPVFSLPRWRQQMIHEENIENED